MSEHEALVAIMNAARVVRAAAGPLPPCPDPRILQHVPVTRAALAGLYAALDAADAVTALPTRTTAEPSDPWQPGVLTPLPRCPAPGCWRQADLPGGTCYHHSAWAAPPEQWTARPRAADD